MAYMLYKYIKKRRAEKSQTKEPLPSDLGLEINNDHQSPFAANEESGDATQATRESKAAANVSEVSKAEQRATRKYRWKLVGCLFLPFSVQALETTIIAGALPFIASDFNQLSQLNWIVSAFNLCSATFIPFWGQIADVFGRYAAIQSALVIMVIGSSLSAGAPLTAFPMLLAGRGLQGVGCAGLNIIIKTVLADKVTLRENALNNTIFTLVAGVAYAIGPVVGGYLTQVTWRWCFIINIPIGVTAFVLIHFILRPELLGPQEITRSDGVPGPSIPQSFMPKVSTIDYGGQFLFLFGMGLLVLALTWGGSYYPWQDTKVLVPLVIGGVLMVLFLVWEYLMMGGNALDVRYPYKKPMIPLNILFTRNAGIIIYINFIAGMAMYAVLYFAAFYFTIVLQFSSAKAGTNIIYYLPGLGLGAYAAIVLCNFKPRQTWWPLFIGTVIEPLGITLLASALSAENKPWIYGMLAVTGLGTGIRYMPGTLHGVGYYRDKIASIVSLILLAAALGGTFSMTIMLNIFNNKLQHDGLSFNGVGENFDSIAALSPETQSLLRDHAKRAIVLAFYAITSFSWLGCIFMMGLGNVDLSKKPDGEGRANITTKGTYIGSLFRRKSNGEGKENI